MRLGVGVVVGCLAAGVPAFGDGIRLEDATAGSGIRFQLRHEPTARKRMIETMAGGLAVFDFDGDGRADIFFTNGARRETLDDKPPSHYNRLYRNRGGLQFADATEEAGVAGEGYSMGAAVADYDNDGDVDLFVAGVFRNILYRNDGDGTFTDVTEGSGIGSLEWSVAAGWLDYDLDGRPDLLVVNYADWTTEFDRFCGDRDRGLRVYCHPKYLTPIANRLYRNLGEGRFLDVSEEAGVSDLRGRGMSVAFGDFDGNGRADAVITNDNLPNFLLLGQPDGTFLEDALLAGVALLDHGRPVASMGVDIGDVNGDGQPDVAVTALGGETFPLFAHSRDGTFRDETVTSGLARASRDYSGWGNVLADFDNDGWVDLFTANSHVNDLVEHFEPFSYLQPNTVFRNTGGRFGAPVEVGKPAAHRGAVAEDFDGDGRVDIVVSSLGSPATLLRNVSPGADSRWVSLDLVGTVSGRSALGARVRIGNQTRWVKGAVGYASARLGPLHFAVGNRRDSAEAVIDWPAGTRQAVPVLRSGRRTTITEPGPGPAP